MSGDRLTTAAELDALPEGTAVIDGEGYQASKQPEGWVYSDSTSGQTPFTSVLMAAYFSPFRVKAVAR